MTHPKGLRLANETYAREGGNLAALKAENERFCEARKAEMERLLAESRKVVGPTLKGGAA